MHLTLQLLLGRQEAAALTTNGLPLGRLLSDVGTSGGTSGGSDRGSVTTWRQLAEKGMVVQVGNHTGSLPSLGSCCSAPQAAELAAQPHDRPSPRHTPLPHPAHLQVGRQLAVLHSGRVAASFDTHRHPAIAALAPQLTMLRPLCVLASQPGARRGRICMALAAPACRTASLKSISAAPLPAPLQPRLP